MSRWSLRKRHDVTHADIRWMVHLWLDGELGDRERRAFEAHIAACVECRELVGAMAAEAPSALRRTEARATPPGFATRVAQTVQEEGHWRSSRPYACICASAWALALMGCALALCTVYGARLPELVGTGELTIAAAPEFAASSETMVRVALLDSRTRQPRAGTKVWLAAYPPRSRSPYLTRVAYTDDEGMAHVAIRIPDFDRTNVRLVARARNGWGDSRAQLWVPVSRRLRVLVSSDQHVYHPGQDIQVRAQVLSAPSGEPAVGEPVALTIADPRGRVLYRATDTVPLSGVVTARLPLAEMAASGAYSVSAATAEARSGRTVVVEPGTAGPVTVAGSSSESAASSGGPHVVAVPQGGALLMGMPAPVLVLTTDAMGHPAPCRLDARFSSGGRTTRVALRSGASGLAAASLTATGPSGALSVVATDERGRVASRRFALPVRSREGLVVYTDKALYRAGERLQLSVACGAEEPRVLVDVTREGQPIWSGSAPLADGYAELGVDLTGDLSGLLVVQARRATAPAQAAAALAFVEPRQGLSVSLRPDRRAYSPGDSARLGVRVETPHGFPAQASVWLAALDERTFNAAKDSPAALATHLMAQPELLAPVAGAGPEGPLWLLSAFARDPARFGAQARARCLLAACTPTPVLPAHDRDLPAGALARARARGASTVAAATRLWLVWALGSVAVAVAMHQAERRWRRRHTRFERHWAGPPRRAVALTAFAVGLGVVSVPWAVGVLRPTAAPEAPSAATSGPDQDAPKAAESPAMLGADDLDRLCGPYAPALGGGRALVFSPDLDTDASGWASAQAKLPESPGRWRLVALAVSPRGDIGWSEGTVVSSSEIGLSLEVPPAAIQDDWLLVPVTVRNGGTREATVDLSLAKADWFAPRSPLETRLVVPAGGASTGMFAVLARRAGVGRFAIEARAGSTTTKAERLVDVAPSIPSRTALESGVADGEADLSVYVPDDAHMATAELTVTLFPDLRSQIGRALELASRQPAPGCRDAAGWLQLAVAEQALPRATSGNDEPPEPDPNGRSVALALQTLLSYQTDTGGFGPTRSRPSAVETSLALMALTDLTRLRADAAPLRAAARSALARMQAPDGSFAGARADALTRARTTALAAWALAETGLSDSVRDRALAHVEEQIGSVNDGYTLALSALALQTSGSRSRASRRAVERLLDAVAPAGSGAPWPLAGPTLMGAEGDLASAEASALACAALADSRRSGDLVRRAVRWLYTHRGGDGMWGSPARAALALGALSRLGDEVAEAQGTVTVSLNGERMGQAKITPGEPGPPRPIRSAGRVRAGENQVVIRTPRGVPVPYVVTAEFRAPSAAEPGGGGVEPACRIVPDTVRVTAGGRIRARVTVSAGSRHCPGVSVRIDSPAGLVPAEGAGGELLRQGAHSAHVASDGGSVTVGLGDLAPGEVRQFEVALVARSPARLAALRASVGCESLPPRAPWPAGALVGPI